MNKSILTIPVVLSLCACASITSGTTQSIAVDTKPAGAECRLTNDKGSWTMGETPSSISVHRSGGALSVNCNKGRLKGIETVESHTKGSAFGNIIFGGIIGGAVDMGNGAAYDYPSSVFVKLK